MKTFKQYLALLGVFVLGGVTMFGFSTAQALLTFPDVESGAYYETAVQNMATAGLITGYSDGNFGPNDPLTRGQIAVIMDRFWSKLAREGVVDPISLAVSSQSSSRSSTRTSSSSSSSSSNSSSSLATSGDYFKFSVETLTPLESTPKASVSVTRVGSTAGDVTVQYETVNGTATGGEDFTVTSGTLSFKSGETSKNITVNLKEDETDEDDETFTIRLKNPSDDMGIGAPNEVKVTILDNDEGGGSNGGGQAGVQGRLQFAARGYAISESAGEVTITVERTDGDQGEVTVEYSTIGDTATSEHFTVTSGTLTFADGEDEKEFTVEVKNNSTTDGYKTVDLYLKNVTGGAVLGINEAVLTIIDDELTENNPGKISFVSDDGEVDERDGMYYALVKRTSGATGTVTIEYETQDSTADEYNDYTPVSGTLTFAEGESLKAIAIEILEDDDSESAEEFIIDLSNPTGGAELINPMSQYVTID